MIHSQFMSERTSIIVRSAYKTAILSQEHEYHLACEWKQNQNRRALSELLQAHLKLVLKIARSYAGYGFCQEDLVAEGNMGMMQAAQNFDPSRGFRFSTYAMWWIKATIQEYVLHNWSLVKIGTTTLQKKLFFSLRKLQREINDNATDPIDLNNESVDKIAQKLGVNRREIDQMRVRMGGRDQSLNAPMQEDNDTDERIHFLRDDRDNHEAIILHKNEMENRQSILKTAFESLNPREQIIFQDRRMNENPSTLEALSQKLAISRERVRQIENEAFDKIQIRVKQIISKQK